MVTLKQIIIQVEAQRKADAEKFKKLIAAGRAVHYKRDSKLAVWDTLLERLYKAYKEKALIKDAVNDLTL